MTRKPNIHAYLGLSHMLTMVVMATLATTFLVAQISHAESATWSLNPVSGDWNTAANWMPPTIPNGPADVATFGLSNTTDISVSTGTEVNRIVFNSGASEFTISASMPGAAFTISGVGIANNSGIVQNLVVSAGNPTQLNFTNSAIAGSLTVITNKAGTSDFSFERRTFFFDSSSADQSTIINEGSDFNDIVSGSTQFLDTSTAGNATVINEAGRHSGTGNPLDKGASPFSTAAQTQAVESS